MAGLSITNGTGMYDRGY